MRYSSEKSYRESHTAKNYGSRYAAIFAGDNYNNRLWELEKMYLDEIISKYFNDKKIENYLDFACGTGRACSFLKLKADNVIGVDISEEMIKEASNKDGDIKFFVTDITTDSLPELDSKKFDLITAFRFFLNAENKLKKNAAKKLKTLLKDEGFLIFNIHGNKNSLRRLPCILENTFSKNPKSSEMSIKEITSLMSEAGFQIKEICGTNFLPQLFAKILSRKSWMLLEKNIKKIGFLNKYAINLIIVAAKNDN